MIAPPSIRLAFPRRHGIKSPIKWHATSAMGLSKNTAKDDLGRNVRIRILFGSIPSVGHWGIVGIDQEGDRCGAKTVGRPVQTQPTTTRLRSTGCRNCRIEVSRQGPIGGKCRTCLRRRSPQYPSRRGASLSRYGGVGVIDASNSAPGFHEQSGIGHLA